MEAVARSPKHCSECGRFQQLIAVRLHYSGLCTDLRAMITNEQSMAVLESAVLSGQCYGSNHKRGVAIVSYISTGLEEYPATHRTLQ